MEIKFKQLDFDFSTIKELDDMHLYLKEKFGFPEFYGKNIPALIDCWSSLRYPEDEMCGISISPNECLILKITGIASVQNVVLQNLLIAIEDVNNRCIYVGENPSIYFLIL